VGDSQLIKYLIKNGKLSSLELEANSPYWKGSTFRRSLVHLFYLENGYSNKHWIFIKTASDLNKSLYDSILSNWLTFGDGRANRNNKQFIIILDGSPSDINSTEKQVKIRYLNSQKQILEFILELKLTESQKETITEFLNTLV